MKILNQRKHRTQMTQQEIQNSEQVIRSIPDWKFTRHSLKSGKERIITTDETLAAIRLGRVFEAHTQTGELRVGIRFDDGSPASICVIVAPCSHEVVTVYRNHANDNHSTLNWSLYRGNFSLDKLLVSR